MKRLVATALVALMLASCQEAPKGYVINGEVTGRRSRILGDQTVYVIPFFKNLLGILLKDCIDRRITDRNRFAVITYPHIHIRIFDKELNRIIHIFCCQTKQ